MRARGGRGAVGTRVRQLPALPAQRPAEMNNRLSVLCQTHKAVLLLRQLQHVSIAAQVRARGGRRAVGAGCGSFPHSCSVLRRTSVLSEQWKQQLRLCPSCGCRIVALLYSLHEAPPIQETAAVVGKYTHTQSSFLMACVCRTYPSTCVAHENCALSAVRAGGVPGLAEIRSHDQQHDKIPHRSDA